MIQVVIMVNNIPQCRNELSVYKTPKRRLLSSLIVLKIAFNHVNLIVGNCSLDKCPLDEVKIKKSRF